jgi:hypothetical protein
MSCTAGATIRPHVGQRTQIERPLLGDAAPATLVAFSAQIRPPAENSVKGKLGVTFLVDVATLSAEDASGGKHLNLAFFATLYSPDGKMLDNTSQKVDQTFNAEAYQQVLQHGLMLHMNLDPKPAPIRCDGQCRTIAQAWSARSAHAWVSKNAFHVRSQGFVTTGFRRYFKPQSLVQHELN